MGNLGVRMKRYEEVATSSVLMPRLPICARVDGRCFHNFCKHMAKPFSPHMEQAMAATAKHLLGDLNAVVVHTFSDEINIILHAEGEHAELPFGGKIFKLNSVIASIATAFFNKFDIWDCPPRRATFDCRVWQVPSKEEAVNYLIWREQDAARNSISMVAQAHYSHKELHKKSSKDMHEMLHMKGINWNDMTRERKRGIYFVKRVEYRELSKDECDRIPEKHRPTIGQKFPRVVIKDPEWPRLTSIANRVGVIFGKEEVILDRTTPSIEI